MSIGLPVVALILSLFENRYRRKAICCFWWMVFPLFFPRFAKMYGLIKASWVRWVIVFLSPFWLLCFIIGLFVVMILEGGGGGSSFTPDNTAYHTAYDLEKATGVKFPEIVAVDSLEYDDPWCRHFTRVTFVPKKPLTKKFFKRLDRACKEDSCCWRKGEVAYEYSIYPERPLDRTKGSHRRSVDWDGKSVPEWDGDYVSVKVPFKGDTITIEDGWCR